MTSDRSERLKNLSAAKRELLLKAIQAKKPSVGKAERIPRRTSQESAPLSFSQQRMWFLQQWEPGSPLYNIPMALRLSGKLDRVALKQAFEEIIKRHDILHTTFDVQDGVPVQVIHTSSALALPLIDLCELSEVLQETLVQELIAAESKRVFDVQQGPLLRVVLLKRAKTEHVLILTVHHIVADGWSMQIVLGELCALYGAFSLGLSSALEEPPLQYADYAEWQRQWLQGPILERQLGYWKQQLANLPTLELALDRPRPAVLSFRGASFPFALSSSLTQRLHQLSKQQGVTLFIVLLTTFQILLARYSHQRDIMLGTPVANRNRKELERLIGYFSNMLVLRTDLSGNPTFREALLRVRDVCFDAYTHQDLPFERLVEELQPERDRSRNPLFQVMFALQNEPMSEAEMPGLEMEELAVQSGISRLDLSLNMTELQHGLVGEVEYSTDLFRVETIAALVERYSALLESVITHTDQRMLEFPILTEAEEQQFSTWNATDVPFPQHGCLHELFETQVARAPEAVAIAMGDQQVTYSHLNACANELAVRLQRLGAGPETLVGICVERSLEMVIALLGTLKAAAVCVPLDPNYPQERLLSIVSDAKIAVLLTHGQIRERLSAYQVQVTLCSVHSQTMLEQVPVLQTEQGGPRRNVLPGNLAYLLYTSGSTGKPKGVALPHTALVNRLLWGQRAYPLSETDRVLQIAPFSFDISIWEIFGPLLAGARLILAQADGHYDTRYLVEVMAQQQVTIAHFVPATLRVVLHDPHLRERCFLRAIFCGGDAVPEDLPGNTVAALNVDFHQFYGPTESAINSTCWIYRPEESQRGTSIGRPIANTHIYLLDADLLLVPLGTPGELYIGGLGVARGYVNQPELTAERFIPHPFSSKPGERLYRTGDLARYQPDGTLEFLGRTDNQVKIRGIRVELGEIETVLRTHPAVQDCVVVVREDRPGDKRLVAYIVGNATVLPADENTGGSASPQEERVGELWPSIGEYAVYDELIYASLTGDERRNEKYKAAIARLVPGKTVLDIGTGQDAILAQFCAEAGARKVYAIEILEESYKQAVHRTRSLGLEDTITVIQGNALDVEIPEKVDVCVSELFEAIGGGEGAAVILNNARRFLKENGVMIPERSITYIAAVRLPVDLRQAPGFTKVSAHYVEKIFEQVGYPFDLRLCIRDFPPSLIVSTRAIFEELQFSGDVEPEYSREITLTIQQQTQIDGFLLWLNLQTVGDEGINIMEEAYSWSPVYFPVFSPPINVEKGDIIQATCTCTLSDNQLNPDYAISGRVMRNTQAMQEFAFESSHHKKRYKATPFYQQLFARDQIPLEQAQQMKRTALPLHLSTYLRASLPNYMVPAAFVLLNHLPLNPNGKVDRRALPAPEDASGGREQDSDRPRNPVEQTLATIFQRVLQVEHIPIHQTFFELGGHSLLAMQALSAIREMFNVEISLPTFFEKSTVADLAAIVTQNETQKTLFPAAIKRIPRDNAEQLLEQLPQLSDDDIDALLAERLLRDASE
ncbi:MAG TPA: amino acid adenylation domain-containing protein [Ktedonobacteraceae bacterium]|nr:amino acid adenylation domain-containing protein [Ktedonobacteraceae bacterium]